MLDRAPKAKTLRGGLRHRAFLWAELQATRQNHGRVYALQAQRIMHSCKVMCTWMVMKRAVLLLRISGSQRCWILVGSEGRVNEGPKRDRVHPHCQLVS